jgi:PIN domain nuclease of toxin-antitoxin system
LTGKLPARARTLIEERAPVLSPVAALELRYLHEVGRARDSVPVMLAALRQEIGIEVTDGSIAELGQAAADLSWTRDPFDRLISAHAIVANAPLVTADETIREHLPLAVWD